MVFIALVLGMGTNPFETPPLETAEAILSTGRLGLEAQPSSLYGRGIDGLFYSLHEIGSLSTAVPVVTAARFFASAMPGVAYEDVRQICSLIMGAMLFATTIALLVSTANAIGCPLVLAGRWIPIVLASSQYLVYVAAPADVSLSAPLMVGTYFLWRRAERDNGWWWFMSGFSAGMLDTIKLTNAPIALILLGFSLLRGSRQFVACFAGQVPGLMIMAWWNWIRNGSIWEVSYPLHRFDVRWLGEGLIGSFVSPGKGLLIYSPVLVLLVFAARRWRAIGIPGRDLCFVFGSFAIALLRIGGTMGWDSFGGWGIRYYVPWIPLFALFIVVAWCRALVKSRWLKLLLLSSLFIGFSINFAGIATNFHYRQALCGHAAWSWRSANVCAIEALPTNLARVVGVPVPEIVVEGTSTRNVSASNRLAMWWYAMRFAGVPAWISWVLGFSLLTLALVCGRKALVELAKAPEDDACQSICAAQSA